MKHGLVLLQVIVLVVMGGVGRSSATTYTVNTPGAAMQSIALTEGDVLTSDTIKVPTLPSVVGAPIFHLDASATNGWEFNVVNGTNFVTKAPSATGDGRYLEYSTSGGLMLRGPFLREGDPELMGGRVLDFGKQGSRQGLFFDGGKLENIGTIIAVWGSQNGGGWVLGGGEWTAPDSWVHSGYGFHRGINPENPATGDNNIIAASRIFKSPAYPGIAESRCWLDGTEVNPTTMGFSGNYQLLSVVCANIVPWAAGIGVNDTRDPGRSSGQRVAEMIIYGKLLDNGERQSVEAYLTKKWFGRSYTGYNNQVAVAEVRASEMCEIAVPTSETLTITSLTERGSPQRTPPARQTVKSGAGTLELSDAAGFSGPFLFQAGGLSLQRRAVPTALPAAPVFRMDASATASFDTVVDSGATRVTAWRDADGRSFAAAPLTAANRPLLLTNAVNGKAVIDFGAYQSGQFLNWNTNMAFIGTVLWVVGAQNGGGHLMGHDADNACHFQRGGDGSSQGSLIWSGAGSKVAMQACPTYVNGVRVNGTTAHLNYGYQVVAVQTPGSFANQFAGHLSNAGDYSRTGGQRLAEVVAYNRMLSDQELADAQAYLMRKWLNADAPGYTRLSRSRPDLQELTVNEELPITFNVPVGAIRLGSLSGSGDLIKRGGGDLELQNSSSFGGTITLQSGNLKTAAPSVTPNAPAEEPAFHLDATRAETLETVVQNGTNFITQWSDVSGWRNAARLYGPEPWRPRPWLRTDDPANGHPVVDFGLRASCRVLVFDKPVNHIRAAYIIIGTQDGCGNFLLGSADADNCDFHRGGDDTLDDPNRPIIGGYDFQQRLRDGSVFIDGVRTNYDAGLSGGYQLVELHPAAGLRASALACDRYNGPVAVGLLEYEMTRRTGAQRLGEVLLYDRPLTEQEKVATRNYLMKKWFNRSPVELPAAPVNTLRKIVVTATSNVVFEADNQMSLHSLTGSGVFEKTGASGLTIADASTFTGTVRVAAGTLTLTGENPPAASELITNGLTFHADATKNVEWSLDAGVRRVTRWGSAVGDGWFAYPPVNRPEYKAAQLDGLPVVDLGPMGSLQHMLFCNTNAAVGVTNRITNIRSVFWVLGSQNGGGYLLGGGTNASSPGAHYNFHRGVKVGHFDVVDPVTPDHYLWGGPSDPYIRDVTSKTYLNGVVTNGASAAYLSGGYDMIGLVMGEHATEAEGFAFDGRYLEGGGYPDRSGGQRLAEVLIYNRALPDDERQRLEVYLQRKWSLRPYLTGDGMELTLSVADGATVDIRSGSALPVAYLTGLGTISGGTLRVLEGISAGDEDGQVGTLTIEDSLILADGATIDVDLAPPAADQIIVGGSCTLGANVIVNLRNAELASGISPYRTEILSCGALVNPANVSTWTVSGDLPSSSNATLYAAGGSVWLRISRKGLLLLIR